MLLLCSGYFKIRFGCSIVVEGEGKKIKAIICAVKNEIFFSVLFFVIYMCKLIGFSFVKHKTNPKPIRIDIHN